MALVEILASSLHAGANLRKLEVGSVVEVDDATASRWISSGKAKETDQKEGEKLSFEVQAPSDSISPGGAELQSKLDEALEQLKQALASSEVKDKEHAATLEQLKQALASSEVKDKEHAATLEQLKQAHESEMSVEKKRADTAEAALVAANKKDK
ncbi:hypothetical protein JEM67_09985 [Serratia sp. PAMC26656]|uniref:hypothetical protein n=1 Tax=Serratia sp. PAMC26656 TaxID=2775909 RepID=UPI0018F3AAC0|nr:hypothetical protein [Serratia sp. PAMC26656]MBJ7894165.1 hypothetical protein [Serratia sp. PAMC26656]